MDIAKIGEFGLIDRLTNDLEIKNQSTLKVPFLCHLVGHSPTSR